MRHTVAIEPAVADAIFYPAAVALFAYCLKGYRRSVAETGHWQL